jgi:hypothetical protein
MTNLQTKHGADERVLIAETIGALDGAGGHRRAAITVGRR